MCVRAYNTNQCLALYQSIIAIQEAGRILFTPESCPSAICQVLIEEEVVIDFNPDFFFHSRTKAHRSPASFRSVSLMLEESEDRTVWYIQGRHRAGRDLGEAGQDNESPAFQGL